MNKVCELCKSPAKIYCESDAANLCWGCDIKVHSANFLVARHLRNLLCHVCQSPTAWNASGEKLGRTISVCRRCVPRGYDRREEREAGNENEVENDLEEEGESAGDVDEDGDNQVVVPLLETSPPPPASSSISEESSSRFCNGGRDICLKRLRQNSLDLCSEDDLDCASSERLSACAAVAAEKSPKAGREFTKGMRSGGGSGGREFTSTAFVVDSLSRIQMKSQKNESNQSPRVHQRLAGSKSEAVVQTRKKLNRNSGEGRNNRRDDDGDSSVSS